MNVAFLPFVFLDSIIQKHKINVVNFLILRQSIKKLFDFFILTHVLHFVGIHFADDVNKLKIDLFVV